MAWAFFFVLKYTRRVDSLDGGKGSQTSSAVTTKMGHLSGCSSMAERQLPKLHTGVRFPSPAPEFGSEEVPHEGHFFIGEPLGH
jgi:hypothetical protein